MIYALILQHENLIIMLNINLSISTLIAGFEAANSGYRKKYRNQLRKRFRYSEWQDQLAILEAFIRSKSLTDKRWLIEIIKSEYNQSLMTVATLYDKHRVATIRREIETYKLDYVSPYGEKTEKKNSPLLGQ